MNSMKKYFILPLLMALVMGCQSTDKPKPDPLEKWRTLAQTSQAKSPVPRKYKTISPPKKQLIPPPKSREKQPKTPRLPRTKITMKMHNVPIATLLRTLARAADMNIMINESVKGNANINIKNTPWSQVFKGVIHTYGLAYEWSDNILRVITVEDLQKDISMMEARQKFEKSKKEHALAMMAIQQEEKQLAPLETRIININYTDLSTLRDNIEAYLKGGKMGSSPETPGPGKTLEPTTFRGTILQDPSANALIVQATSRDMDRILPIISALDRPSQQILIEAHIVEANSDTARELGIQWGGLALGDKNRNWAGGIDEDAANGDLNTPQNPTGGPVINFPSSPDAGSEDWNGFTLGFLRQELGDYLLYAQLTALEKEGKLNILSKPSITTMDHQKAIIESGRDVPFQTVEDDEVSIQWKKAVIKLEVTPHVIGDQVVLLDILTHKDELDWSQTVAGNPTIITKNAETRVNLFNGQTTVIGGLNKEKLMEREAGIPFLKDIPGLGHLFKNNGGGQDMEELLIFITPHILEKSFPPGNEE